MTITADILKARKAAGKNQWYFYTSPCSRVEVKGFNQWLQIFRIDGIKHWSPTDQTVKQLTELINSTLGTVGIATEDSKI
jgi:hypothetical protein